MFRMWCKLFDDRGHLIKDTVIKNADSDLNRTRKIFAAIHDACAFSTTILIMARMAG